MPSSNNAINNTVGASVSGVTNTLTVTNPSNTASSAARETITVGGGSAGDPTLNFNVSGVTNFEMGIDNSSSDRLTISQGTALGTNDVWRMTTAGERTLPLQPAFLGILGVSDLNALGNGVVYTYGSSGTALTEIFDQGSDFNPTTGVFTAPATGRYILGMSIDLSNLAAAHTDGDIYVATTAREYHGPFWNPVATQNIGSGSCVQTSVLAEMTSGDTATFNAQINFGTQTITVTAILSACRVWGLLAV